MNLADNLLALSQRFEHGGLDLNNVLQLAVGPRLPTVVDSHNRHGHHQGESVHGALLLVCGNWSQRASAANDVPPQGYDSDMPRLGNYRKPEKRKALDNPGRYGSR
jgi:hypothetical protein